MQMKKFKMSEKTIKLLVAIGICGIVLIFVSSLFSDGKKDDKAAQTIKKETADYLKENEEYAKKLEERLSALLESMEGVGSATVMVTIEKGAENVYITEENVDMNTSKESDQRRSSEKKTLLIEDENGRKKALLRMTLSPVISGILVICEGGGNPLVVEKVTDALKSSLSISSNRISVMPLVNPK